MPDRKSPQLRAFIVTCVLLAVVVSSWLYYRDMRKTNIKLKQDEIILRAQMDQKIKALSASEKKISELEDQIGLIRAESDMTRSEFAVMRRKLLKRSVELCRKLKKIENMTLESVIERVVEKEDRPGIKKRLLEILTDVKKTMGGKFVTLEPIVVTKSAEEATKEAIRADSGSFTVVALDRKNNLIAVNAGRKDNLKENDRLVLRRSGQEMASASVIAVRYRVASAFIDRMRRNYTIKDIKEGDEVVFAE